MRVLVACEASGIVRDAFSAKGHDAWSSDLLPAEGQHYQGDALDAIALSGWDLLIAHPPCTYLCASGMHRTTRGLRDPGLTETALDFVRALMDSPVPCIAIENPVGCISTRICRACQYVQPYQFGHDASKRTGLWLKGLPPLIPTSHVAPRIVGGKKRWANQTDGGQNRLEPAPDRWRMRSLTYPGIAAAMAEQWGNFIALRVTFPCVIRNRMYC